MKWTYLLRQKIKIAVSLTIIILMVLMVNVLNKRHFNELQESLSSVYEDRLLVEVYIYKITAYLNEKSNILHGRELGEVSGLLERNNAINDSISVLIKDFSMTLFTEDESIIFAQLKDNLGQLYELENAVFRQLDKGEASEALELKAENKLKELAENLHLLSDIQQNEGQRLTEASNKIILNSKFALQLELVVLIVIGLIVQALVFAANSSHPKIKQNSRLN